MTARPKSAAGSVLALAPVLLVLTARPAHAYIDPGTGSYVLQAVAATVLAAFFVVKTSWRQVREHISHILGRRSPTGPEDGR